MLGIEVAKDCLRAFLTTDFAGGRHTRRVAKIG
jgi:ribose 5-phosphate isomerase RpiB